MEATSVSAVDCVLPARAFRLLWATLVLLYGLVTLYLLGYAAMYALFYSIPIASYYVATFQLLPTSYYRTISAAYLAMALLFAQQLARILFHSVRQRGVHLTASHSDATTKHRPTVSARLQQLLPRQIRDAYAHVFGATGILGVRGPYFAVMTLLRELFEVLVQVQQAYQTSRYTASWQINIIFGGLIVTNCFSTPLLHLFVAKSGEISGHFRLAVLLVDLVLDLVWFLLLPLLFWIPYIHALTGSDSLLFEDSFMSRAVMELRFLFVTSFGDLVFGKLLPAVNCFLTLRKLQSLVRKHDRTLKTTRSRGATWSVRLRIHPFPHVSSIRAAPSQTSRASVDSKRMRCLETLLVYMLAAVGVFTFSVYAVTYGIYSPQCTRGCKLELRPWFQTDRERCFCAVQEINCYEHGIQGNAEELTRTLATVEADGLLSLMLTHCPQLVIPAGITRFRDLFRFEIFNCTIRSWEREATLTASAFPRLGLLQLIYTFLDEIPSGLLHGDLPPSLVEIEIVASNLTALPMELGALWPHVQTLYLESARFSTFPAALSEMPHLQSLSLFGNNLTVIADDAFRTNSFEYLHLGKNPISSVPTSLCFSTQLVNLHLLDTKIPDVEAATSWRSCRVDDETVSPLLLFGHESPFCVGETLEKISGARLTVDCRVKTWTYRGETAPSWYPLHAKLRERALTPIVRD